MAAADKVAVITGGASGIGRATATALAARGYRIAVWDRDRSTSSASDDLGNAIVLSVDVADPDEVREALSATTAALGKVDVLVAAAAVGTYAPIVDLPDDEWRRVMSTDLDGVFWCLREAAREMKRHGAGSIVLIGSDRGVQPEPGWTAYSVAKAAVIQLGRAAALEFAPDVRVNVINPGPTDTPLLDQTLILPGVHERISNAPPLRRLAAPAEIAGAIVFVAEHSYMTGSVVSVDGGMALAGPFGIRDVVNEANPKTPPA